MKRRLRAGRALVSRSRTWCFSCTNTRTHARTQHWLFSWIKPWTLRVTGQRIRTGPRCCPLQIYSETYYWRWSRWQEGYEGDPRRKNTSTTDSFNSQVYRQCMIHSVHRLAHWRHTVESVHFFFFLAQQSETWSRAAWLTVSIVCLFPHRMFWSNETSKTRRQILPYLHNWACSRCTRSTNVSVRFPPRVAAASVSAVGTLPFSYRGQSGSKPEEKIVNYYPACACVCLRVGMRM